MFKFACLFCIFDLLFDTMSYGIWFWAWVLFATALIDCYGKENGRTMRHSEVLAKFLWHCPEYTNLITHWAPAGENAIHVIFEDNTEMVFTYVDERNWTLAPARKGLGRGLLGRLFN